MNVLDVLKTMGQMEASSVAYVLGQPVELVYEHLVMCESLGLARVVVQSNRGGMPYGEWTAA